jgi:hypothetical protein
VVEPIVNIAGESAFFVLNTSESFDILVETFTVVACDLFVGRFKGNYRHNVAVNPCDVFLVKFPGKSSHFGVVMSSYIEEIMFPGVRYLRDVLNETVWLELRPALFDQRTVNGIFITRGAFHSVLFAKRRIVLAQFLYFVKPGPRLPAIFALSDKLKSIVTSRAGLLVDVFGFAVFQGDRPLMLCTSDLIHTNALSLETLMGDPASVSPRQFIIMGNQTHSVVSWLVHCVPIFSSVNSNKTVPQQSLLGITLSSGLVNCIRALRHVVANMVPTVKAYSTASEDPWLEYDWNKIIF